MNKYTHTLAGAAGALQQPKTILKKLAPSSTVLFHQRPEAPINNLKNWRPQAPSCIAVCIFLRSLRHRLEGLLLGPRAFFAGGASAEPSHSCHSCHSASDHLPDPNQSASHHPASHHTGHSYHHSPDQVEADEAEPLPVPDWAAEGQAASDASGQDPPRSP